MKGGHIEMNWNVFNLVLEADPTTVRLLTGKVQKPDAKTLK